MQKSAYFTTEYTKDKKIELTNIISIWAYNNGEAIAYIDGYPIYPKNKSVVFASDFSICDPTLQLSFKPFSKSPTTNISNRPNIESGEIYLPIDGIIPAKIEPKIRQSVILYIKKLI